MNTVMSQLKILGQFRESVSQDSPDYGFVWDVSVIGEGEGLNYQRNKKDGKLYKERFTRKGIQSVIPRLEGTKVKAFRFEDNKKEKRDHLPIELDDELNHRSVGNNVGILTNPREVEVDGKLHAFATMHIVKDDYGLWLRDLLLWATTSGFSDYVGLSINTKGSTEYTIDENGGRYLDVNEMFKPRSVEVVDTPAAKGAVKTQFVRIIQGYKSGEHSEQGENIMDNKQESIKEAIVQESTVSDNVPVDTVQDSTEHVSDLSTETVVSQAKTSEVIQTDTVSTETTVTEKEDVQDSVVETTMEKTEATETIEEIQVTESVANDTLLSPLKTYLQNKGIIYQGENIRDIVESIDLTGLGLLDQAALKELRNLLKNGKLNSAKNLINDMISSMYRALNALDYLDEYKMMGLIKESAATVKKDVADIQTQTPTSMKVDEHVEEQKVLQESSQENIYMEQEVKDTEVKEQATTITESAKPLVDNSALLEGLKEVIASTMVSQKNEVEALKAELKAVRESVVAQPVVSPEIATELMAQLTAMRESRERDRMSDVIRESGLLPEVQQELSQEIGERILSSDEVRKMVERKRNLITRLNEAAQGAGNPFGLGAGEIRMGADAPQKLQTAMDRLFMLPEPKNNHNSAWEDPGCKFASIRQGYSMITGDFNVTGEMNQRYIREAVIGHDTFEKTLSNTMNRYLVNWNETNPMVWPKLVSIRYGVRDFKSLEMVQVGGFGNLQIMNDSGASPNATGFAQSEAMLERQGAYKPLMRGRRFTVTEMMIKNDDLYIITRMLNEAAKAAEDTVMTAVFAQLIGGFQYMEANPLVGLVPNAQINTDNIYSGTASRKLYATDNSGTTAFDYDPLVNAIQTIKGMRKMGNGKPLNLRGKKLLIVPNELEMTAMKMHPSNTVKEPFGADNTANILPKDLEIISVDRQYLGDDANNWYVMESPASWEGIQIGFVDDEINPRIILANVPNQGRTFSHGGLEFVVRRDFGIGVAGHEGFFGSFVANH